MQFHKYYYLKHLTNTQPQIKNFLIHKNTNNLINIKSPQGLTEQIIIYQTVKWFMQILVVF